MDNKLKTIQQSMRRVAANFQKVRENWKLSQKEFGEVLESMGLEAASQSLVSDWENGKRIPTMQTIIAYSFAYNVDPKFFLGIDDTPQPMHVDLDFGDDEFEKALENLRDIDPNRYDDLKDIAMYLQEKYAAINRGEV